MKALARRQGEADDELMSAGVFPPQVATTGRRSIDDELRTMIQADRVENLQRTLDRRPLGACATKKRRSSTRMTLALDNNTELQLRLYRPTIVAPAMLLSVRFDDRIGWVVGVRTTDGERVIVYAWLATLLISRFHA